MPVSYAMETLHQLEVYATACEAVHELSIEFLWRNDDIKLCEVSEVIECRKMELALIHEQDLLPRHRHHGLLGAHDDFVLREER